nr:PLP-dependent aminotransferase family protein [Streptomyces sp. ISID311]
MGPPVSSRPSLERRRGSPSLLLPITLDRTGAATLTDQLVIALREGVHQGLLLAGARLPSTRTLATELAVSRTVAADAYARLTAEGYLEGRHGSGTYVCDLNDAVRRSRGAQPLPERPPALTPRDPSWLTFRTGVTAPEVIPEGWAPALREVARTTPPNHSLDAQGEPWLRAAIAAYLARSRGLAAEPDDVVVTTGTTESLDLILRTLVRPGDTVASEEPGHPHLRALLELHGVSVVPMPVDNDGARPYDLPRGPGGPRVAHVTPSHQFPLGVRMTIGRRLDLIAWAREEHAFVLEDDYDSEYRFDGPPLPTLTGLDQERVIYLGTLSKVLTPAFRCGYLVAPHDLARRLTQVKGLTAGPASWPVQRALFHLLESGDLERHIRRTRQRYARARATLRDALAPLAGSVRLVGIEAGLHVVLRPEAGLRAERIAEEARAQGVSVVPLTEFYAASEAPEGFLLGYAGLTEEELAEAAGVLARTIEMLR